MNVWLVLRITNIARAGFRAIHTICIRLELIPQPKCKCVTPALNNNPKEKQLRVGHLYLNPEDQLEQQYRVLTAKDFDTPDLNKHV